MSRSFALILVLATTALGQPPVFEKLDFGAAKAKAGDRLLVLDAMTSWCGPCKKMDKTTWVDPALVGWMEEHALAIQLDMDEHEQVKTGLGINAFPTIVVFKGGREIDRTVGLKDAPWMLNWLKGLQAGITAKDTALATLEELREKEPSPAVLRQRMNLAGEVYAGGELEKATAEYLALWRLIPKHAPLMQRARRGEMRWRMKALAQRHEPALKTFTMLRDDLRDAVNGESPEIDAIRDWIELNTVIGDDVSTIRWAARRADQDVELLRQVEHRIFPMCVAHGDWATAGKMLSDPVAEVRGMGESLGAYDLPSKPKVMPAMPLGGMKPAKKPVAGAKPKVMPGIPMGGMKPAKKPVAGAKPTEKTIPAIPMGGMRPAKKPVAAGRPAGKGTSMPMIPMGGMRPAAKKRPAPSSAEEVARDVRSRLTWQMRQRAAERYAALLSAGRVELAAEVANTALQYADDAATRALLLRRALEAGQMDVRKKQHLVWFDDIAAESGQ